MAEIMTPGSLAAKAHGCVCSEELNLYGHGVQSVIDRRFCQVYFVADKCPLHGAGEGETAKDRTITVSPVSECSIAL